VYKMIIVEDNLYVKDGLSSYFPWHEVGMEISACFTNGGDAYEYIETEHVDVVLSDVVMPVMDGLALASKIHENYPHIKVVLLSAYSNFSYAQKAIEYAVFAYMIKPSKFSQLSEVFSAVRNELDLTNKDDSTTGLSHKINKVCEYVKANYSRACLKSAAEVVGMNPCYLSDYFKKNTGEKFSDYLTKVRMEKAAELLREGKYLTYDVSEMIGFSKPGNFSRCFKDFYGVNPKDYI